MNKRELIKTIAEEFNLYEIKVSEYFENLFETLINAFTHNKNVNISEFGKFKVKVKLNKEGEREKTILFSPVKKFAQEVNYNFNQLSPIQIRVLDEKSLKEKPFEEKYDEEMEEIILIDFEDTTKEIERGKHHEIELQEEIEEKILIPELKSDEIPVEVIQLEDVNIPRSQIEIQKPIIDDVSKESNRILEELSFSESIRLLKELSNCSFSEINFVENEDVIELPKIISDEEEESLKSITTIDAQAEQEELKRNIPEEVIEKSENEKSKLEIIETKEVEKNGEILIPDVSETEIEEKIIQDIPEIEEQKIIQEEIETEELGKTEETDTKKSNVDLEKDLIQMLDERKKILDEIHKLENMDISDLEKLDFKDEEILSEEDMYNKPKQNIFVDENGNILENLLRDISDSSETVKPTSNIEEVINQEDEIFPELKDEKTIEDENTNKYSDEILGLGKDFEKTDFVPDESLNNLENLFSSIYGENKGDEIVSKAQEKEISLNNPEMNVFDKLLDESQKQEEDITIQQNEAKEIENNNLVSFNELEKQFVTFKTEKSEEPIKEEEITTDKDLPVEKTEAIKTYDDIFNLIEPNEKKKEEKIPETIDVKPKKRFPPILKLLIPIALLVIIIFLGIYAYRRLVYKPSEGSFQTQIIDTTKPQTKDSIIYADTNKVKTSDNGKVVYDENGFVIKESEKGFFIYFGNYENQYELAKKIKELKSKNIIMEYEKITSEGKELFKIKAGPYKTLDEAKAIIPKL